MIRLAAPDVKTLSSNRFRRRAIKILQHLSWPKIHIITTTITPEGNMPFEVVMPRLGWNRKKSILVQWDKRDEEYVQAGDRPSEGTSAQTAAAVTLVTEADATELVRMRKQLTADPSQPGPSYNDLLVKLVAQALVEHPAVNARLEDGAIVQSATVNVGLAVDTDRGLLVPVLRDVQAKSLLQIIQESAALIEATRAGSLDPDELSGGTFTVTNLGMYDIDAFTPIINLPECAILGVGRIVPKQVVVDADAEHVAIRRMMFLSLTFDHRLVDGAPAARFLQRVKQYIEQPYLTLMSRTPTGAGSFRAGPGRVQQPT
jgi:hypothetical protein